MTMKESLKNLAILLLASLTLAAPAAVPIRWTVETSRAQATMMDVYRGETLSLSADLTSYGQPLALAGAVALYLQTNGMADAWWTIPATVASNRIEAVLSPTNYPGDATSLNCFLGGPATSYRAAFRLRVLGAPGPAPTSVQFPVRSLDFSTITVQNAPWVKSSGGGVTNFRVVDDKIYFGQQPTEQGQGFIDYYIKFSDGDLKVKTRTGMSALVLTEENIYDVIGESMDWMSESIEDLQQTSESIPQLATSVTNLSNTVNAWQTYWDGDDVRVTVTNYYGQTGMPHLYLEERMQPDDSHDEVWYKTVWDEMTRWASFLDSYNTVTNDLYQNRADRAWGVYDSSSGEFSPDDMLQLSQPTIQIASGIAWQKSVLTSGSVWVLKSTTPATVSGNSSNGFMRLMDADGNTMVEIVKGDRRIVGATATDVQMSGGSLVVTYSVVSADPPTLSVCTDLADPDWKDEKTQSVASITWSGSSGSWVAEVAPIGSRPSMFVRASYETGGSTYISSSVPIGFSKVVIGGHEYTVSVETVNNRKLLVLQ